MNLLAYKIRKKSDCKYYQIRFFLNDKVGSRNKSGILKKSLVCTSIPGTKFTYIFIEIPNIVGNAFHFFKNVNIIIQYNIRMSLFYMPLVKITPAAKLEPKDVILPTGAYGEPAGFDIYYCYEEGVFIPPWSRKKVALGFHMEIQSGFYAEMKSKSGKASKDSIDIGAGTLDADYRGEIHAVVINNSDVPFVVENGMAIAQMVFHKRVAPVFKLEAAESLSKTERGVNGFGSSS